MAAPQVFVSSTYYDLKHLRSALEAFVRGLGYEPILSEKGNIAYSPDAPLDESCYRAARQADIFVLIIGGRYGSAASTQDPNLAEGFFERYDSITKKEYQAALADNVPCYILIERDVYGDYETFRRNRDKKGVEYAHVDSANIFRLIDEILGQRRNNPMFEFERYEDIEPWLRQQWAGLFRDLLGRLTQQEQLTSLSTQVALLSESNKTLKRYLETVVTSVSPTSSESLIDEESRRLEQKRIDAELSGNPFVNYILASAVEPSSLDISVVKQALTTAATIDDIYRALAPRITSEDAKNLRDMFKRRADFLARDVNAARKTLGLAPLDWAPRARFREK